MACETPVVASAVGGIPEVVEHGETGLLVAPETISATEVEPRNPEQFSRDLAAAVNVLLDDPALRHRWHERPAPASNSNSAGPASRDRPRHSTKKCYVQGARCCVPGAGFGLQGSRFAV